MRRAVYHGYGIDGEFYIRTVEESPGEGAEQKTVALSRAECQNISKHMQFGKKGEERVVETVDGKEVK